MLQPEKSQNYPPKDQRAEVKRGVRGGQKYQPLEFRNQDFFEGINESRVDRHEINSKRRGDESDKKNHGDYKRGGRNFN